MLFHVIFETMKSSVIVGTKHIERSNQYNSYAKKRHILFSTEEKHQTYRLEQCESKYDKIILICSNNARILICGWTIQRETDRGKKVRHLKQLRRSHCDFKDAKGIVSNRLFSLMKYTKGQNRPLLQLRSVY